MTETALDWFQRSQVSRSIQKLRRRCKRPWLDGPGGIDNCDNDLDGAMPDEFTIPVSDPSSAGRAFLCNGTSGLAPIDIAWRGSILSTLEHFHLPTNTVPGVSKLGRNDALPNDLFRGLLDEVLPPFVCIEGQHDTGKTWMLSTLAARFVVATRACQPIFDTQQQQQQQHQVQEETDQQDTTSEDQVAGEAPKKRCQSSSHSQPFVVIFDSTSDLTSLRLSVLVRSSLIRHYKRHGCSTTKDGEQEKQFKIDMKDCLSRIHVAAADDGSGWVAILEALRHELRERRQNGSKCERLDPGTPILLLWDGILSEFKSCQSSTVDETVFGIANRQKISEDGSMREILQQIALLIRQESHTLWLVATAPSTEAGSNNISASHRLFLDWMRNTGKRHKQHHASTAIDTTEAPSCSYRETCRIFLERPSIEAPEVSSSGSNGQNTPTNLGVSKASAFARVVVGGDSIRNGPVANNNNRQSKKIPFSLSLQGILS